MGRPAGEQPVELQVRRGRNGDGPHVMRAQRAVLVLQQPGERELPEDVVLGPSGLARQREGEGRQPRWL